MFLSSSTTNRAERAIIAKRNQVDANIGLQTKLKQEFMAKQTANWENKGKDVEKGKFVKKRLEELRAEAKRALEDRRNALSDLLREEEEFYRQELKSMEETPEQVRDRMLKRVQELKETRETARKADVERRLDRRFRENTDDLRKVQSNINELKSVAERNLQIMERQHQMVNQYEEEMVYAELWKRERMKKERKEAEELIKRKEAVDARNQILGLQKEENERKKLDERLISAQEQQMLKDQWRQEEERVKQQDQEQALVNEDLNKELIDHYHTQRALKEREVAREKDADRDMVRGIVEREKALDQIEQEQKDRHKKETRDFLWNFKNRTDEYHTHEEELEKLIRQENDRQWQKREDVWKKEEDARVKLMYNVYDARSTDINMKKDHRMVQTHQTLKEKDKVNEDTHVFENDEERRKYERMLKAKQHQQELLRQIADKTNKNQKVLQSKAEEERVEILRRIELEKHIQNEKEKGKRMLEDVRKQRPF